jgi:bifunctional DNA-binding transcriptional regulator/antitoxin component of YhaV-PrlF toxin-antitoxin module
MRVGEKGLIQVPPRYRRAHRLGKGSRIVAIEVGDALVLVPPDVALERLSGRVKAALKRGSVTTEQALRNLGKVRRRRFRRLHAAEA